MNISLPKIKKRKRKCGQCGKVGFFTFPMAGEMLGLLMTSKRKRVFFCSGKCAGVWAARLKRRLDFVQKV